MFPDLPESRRDVLGMRRGVLDLPQPGLAVRRVMDHEVLSGILAADLCLKFSSASGQGRSSIAIVSVSGK